MIIRALFCLFLLHAFLTSFAQADSIDYPLFENRGYIKYLSSISHIDLPGLLTDNISAQILHHRNNTTLKFSDEISLNAAIRNQFFIGEVVSRNPGLGANLREQQKDILDLSINLVNENQLLLNSALDRLNLEWIVNNWEISLGRQRINWGISSSWNPNDIFNAFSFADFDYEERPGSDALLVRRYTGVTSSIEFGSKLSWSSDRRSMGILWKTNASGYDYQFLIGAIPDYFVLGSGWAGNIGYSGFKGEMAWFKASNETDNALSLTLGIDYLFSNGWYLNASYLYNRLGQSSAPLFEILSFQLSATNLYPYKHSILIVNSYAPTPLINLSFTSVYSPASSHPLFLLPHFSYSLKQDLDLSLVSQIGWNNDRRYRSPFQAYYLRVKWNY